MPDAKILIVEDEAIEAMDVQQRLVGFGYPLPDIAYSGEEGVRKAEQAQPDLILMDIMMPGKLDGVAAAEQIRSRFDIPIIFLTAYADENTLRRAKITAPYGYIVKPFQERELHVSVDMALYRHRMERKLREREKWLGTTLRSIGDAVVATDEKGLITFMNPVAEALMGCTPDEVLRKNLTDVFNIVNRDTRKPVENPVTRVLREGAIVGLANHTVLISRDGREIPINDSAAPIKDDQGNLLGVVLVFSDITERETTEETVIKLNEELKNNVAKLSVANASLRDSRRATLNIMEDALVARKRAEKANAELQSEIAERKRVEEALRESETSVRRKLENILSPEGDLGQLELGDVIDLPAIQSLVDDLYKFVRLPIGILDLKGKVLVGVGWQDICTKFHRAHPDTCRHCMESDLELTRGVSPGEFRLYKCRNGMWDAVTPVMVGGQHMGNLFWGQFFFEDEPLDREFFRSQARAYGFDEAEYLAVLEKVPRISREALDTGMAFYQKLADVLSKSSYGALKLARALAERDAMTESLRASEERLERAQEIAHLGSWELNLVDNVLTWSDEVYRIFGLHPQEFGATYEAFLERVHPDDRAAVNAAYSGSLREGQDAYEIEHRVVKQATGEIRYVHEKCRHFRNADGAITRSIGMVHDITERKKAENEVLKLSEDMAARNLELEVLNRELESFVYSVSHDLRAPLRSVSGFAKIILEDYADRLDEQGRDYLLRIYNGSEKMSQRIEALLRLSKISRQDLDRAPVDLSRVATSIAYDLGQADAGRTVEAVIAPDLTAFVDLNLIKVVLSNLLENAWKFTSKTANARIEFGAAASEAELEASGARNEAAKEQVSQGKTVFFVRDNGAGYDPTYADRIFWPFHRLHSDSEFEGTGIGLAIVERVIRRHGGRIWAEGEPGKGAAFYFTL